MHPFSDQNTNRIPTKYQQSANRVPTEYQQQRAPASVASGVLAGWHAAGRAGWGAAAAGTLLVLC